METATHFKPRIKVRWKSNI